VIFLNLLHEHLLKLNIPQIIQPCKLFRPRTASWLVDDLSGHNS